MQANTKISFSDFAAANEVTYLWIVGVGCPAGQDFEHNPDDDGEDWCNLPEHWLWEKLERGDFSGSVDEKGLWCWDGEGVLTDSRGNTIYNLKAGWAK